MSAGEPAEATFVTPLVRKLRGALGLCWRSSPLTTGALVVLTLVGAAAPVAFGWLLGDLLDQLEADRATPPHTALVGLAVVTLATVLAPAAMALASQRSQRAAGRAATDHLFARVGDLHGLGRFEDPTFLDRLRVAASQGVNSASGVLAAVLAVGRAALTVVGFGVALLSVSVVVSAVLVLSAVPTFVGELSMARRRARAFASVSASERLEMVYSGLFTSVAAAKESRLFGLGSFLRQRLLDERTRADRARDRLDRRDWVMQSLLGVMSVATAMLGLVVAIFLARDGDLSVGSVAITLTAVLGVQAGVGDAAAQLALAQEHLLVFDYYLGILSARDDVRSPASPEPVPALRSEVRLEDVWFRYAADQPWILKGVNLAIPAGTSVALVGPNGAGKSTIVKLLCRFYELERGAITWDGVDVRCFEPSELRKHLSTVFQDFMHYEMTAAENIGVGDPQLDFDRARVREAADIVGMDECLSSLRQGYDTMLTRMFLGDGDDAGVMLSGGQDQRVAIARALFRGRRDLLILDEPNAGLDPRAEHELHLAMASFRRGGASLLVSHRLNAVRDADVIAVLEDGRITERGSHAELLAIGGCYADLFATQASGYQLAAN